MSLVNQVLGVSFEVTQSLRGEPVTLKDAEGTVTVDVQDAIVGMEQATVGDPSQGPARQFGVVRLLMSHRPAALQSVTAIVRGAEFYVVDVGEDLGGFFRCEISTNADNTDGRQTNIMDLDGNQAVWHEAD